MMMFYRHYGKRLLDFAVTLIALVLLSPILLTVAVLVRVGARKSNHLSAAAPRVE